MTLLGLSLTQLAAIFGGVGAALTALYVLKLRRRRVAVPFSQLWERVLQEKQASSLFRKLKRLLSLLLQLFFLFLLVAALGDPRFTKKVIEGREIILLIDASASMKAVDGADGATRIELALERARKLVRGLGGADAMMIVRMDTQVTPLTAFTSDSKTLQTALDKLEASDTRADIQRALKFCADSLHGRKRPMLILIGDGAYDKRLLKRVLVDAKLGREPSTKAAPAGAAPGSAAGSGTGTAAAAKANKGTAAAAKANKGTAAAAKAAGKGSGSGAAEANKGSAPAAGKGSGSGAVAKAGTGRAAAAGKGKPGKGAKPGKGTKPAKGAKRASAADALDAIDLRRVKFHFVPVGKSRNNIGIVAFNARRYPTNKLSFEVFLEIVNYRDRAAEVDLRFSSDGVLSDVKRLTLKPGEHTRYTCTPEDRRKGKKTWCDMAASGEMLSAHLVPAGSSDAEDKGRLDDFPADDRAYALLPRRNKAKVLLVTKGNLFLEGALLLDENLEVHRVAPGAYDPSQLKGVEAIVFDSFFPQKDPGLHTLIVNPPLEGTPFAAKGRAKRPLITEQNTAHPVMNFITLKDVNISDSIAFVRDKKRGDVALASSFRQPVLIARDDGRRKIVAIGWDPKRSDLPLRVSFPMLVINTFNWFAGEDEGLITTYKTGEAWRVPLARTEGPAPDFVEVVNPLRRVLKAPISGSYAMLHGKYVGIYDIKHGANRVRIAANLADAEESRIRPEPQLVVGGRQLVPPSGFGVALRREIWIYLLLIAAALVVLEWLSYNRRLTV